MEYSQSEMRRFDRITSNLSSQDQMTRIKARLEIQKFIVEVGQEKCDEMFKVLQAKDKKRA